MRTTNMKKTNSKTQILLAPIVAVAMLLLTVSAHAAAPGITGPSFDLRAEAAYITQPDGSMIYSWGYGCNTAPSVDRFVPPAITGGFCNTMQIPGPTLVVTEGHTVTVTLTNGLPAAAGNTSILFPGFNVCAGTLTGASASSAGTCTAGAVGVDGLLTREAAPGGTVQYSFYAATPGTRAYYSGTQS